MANPLFQNQIQSQYQSFKTNPMGFLAQRNLNIPQQYANDPEGAVRFLMNNGTMSQDVFNRINQMANQLGLK